MIKKITSSLYSRYYTSKRTGGGAHLRVEALGKRCSEKTSEGWRVVGDMVSDKTDPGIELRPPATIAWSLQRS